MYIKRIVGGKMSILNIYGLFILIQVGIIFGYYLADAVDRR